MGKRIIWLVMDSVGIGELPDAIDFGDEGSDTLVHIYEAVEGFSLPNLERMGLGNINEENIIPKERKPIASYGKAMEVSPGKDTTTGHWEMAGIILQEPFNYYPNGFPKEIIDEFVEKSGYEILFNKAASGTDLIRDMGKEHVRTKKLLVYTSADSVFQIAAHEEVVPINELYRVCLVARKILDKYRVSRVIARPFVGDNPLNYKRTANRRDFSMLPPEETILDIAKKEGKEVIGVGKIEDIFANQGLTDAVHTKSNKEGVLLTLDYMDKVENGIIFTNLVDFDSQYGHRNDPIGYANCLKEFDSLLPMVIEKLNKEDMLIITADHGCDPTSESTDHSREYIPILIYGDNFKKTSIGVRKTFADMASTISEYLNISKTPYGESFLNEIIK